MLLKKFTDVEKEVFLKKFMFFAVQKGQIKEKRKETGGTLREERNLPFIRGISTDGGAQIVQRKFPEIPSTGLRYIMPPKQHRIEATIPMQSSVMQEKFTADVSEKIPEKLQVIENRKLVMSEDELSVPIPKRFEGRKQPETIRFGQSQQGMQEQETGILAKISPFLNDSSIVSIEVASGENVKISRGRDKTATNIVLSDSEVKEVIKEFSQKTRIPLSEFFKANYGDWQINAIMSEIISPRFMLTREKEFPKLGMSGLSLAAFEQSAKIEEAKELVSASKGATEPSQETKKEFKSLSADEYAPKPSTD